LSQEKEKLGDATHHRFDLFTNNRSFCTTTLSEAKRWRQEVLDLCGNTKLQRHDRDSDDCFAHNSGPNMLTTIIEHQTEGKIRVILDEGGYVFIDRSPDVFEVILRYLRSRILDIPATVTRAEVSSFSSRSPP
jgi:hypothetical protein